MQLTVVKGKPPVIIRVIVLMSIWYGSHHLQNGTLWDPDTGLEYMAPMIRFVIRRGLNLNESSHGILGENFNQNILL